MSILSDDSIKNLIQNQQLIINGNLDNAKQCSYRFTPAKIFHGGEKKNVVEFHTSANQQLDAVEPGEYVWIRMKEFVKLPSNMCAFWWQTNNLSRKGLVLMNMSIVEPGYEGPLSCLFVNFGKVPVSISPDMTMAKLVFVQLDQAANRLSDCIGTGNSKVQAYDCEVYGEALARPSTFLQLNDQFSELEKLRNEQLSELKKLRNEAIAEISTLRDGMIKEIKNQTQSSVNEAVQQLTKDVPGTIWKSAGLAAGALSLLLVLSTIAPWVQSFFSPKIDTRVSELVQQELAKWLTIQTRVQPINTTSPPQNEEAALRQQITELEQRLQALEDNQSTQ